MLCEYAQTAQWRQSRFASHHAGLEAIQQLFIGTESRLLEVIE
jgi:hypothetical protein